MKDIISRFFVMWCLLSIVTVSAGADSGKGKVSKPGPDQAIAMLKEGNRRFVEGKLEHPHLDAARLTQAGKESQADHAYATIVSCSDSRVPVELIFDAGIMDIFVVRVAGNVCDVDEIGSIEYGLAHVHTPLLVILGHTQCGAVTAVTQSLCGNEQDLEGNIPPLVDNIKPAVRRAMQKHPDLSGDALIHCAIEENVWQGIEDLFTASLYVRNMVKEGKARVAGALYDVGSGKVDWLPEKKVSEILKKVDSQ
ncbi:MAG: carbonic anhydrase [bacterium]